MGVRLLNGRSSGDGLRWPVRKDGRLCMGVGLLKGRSSGDGLRWPARREGLRSIDPARLLNGKSSGDGLRCPVRRDGLLILGVARIIGRSSGEGLLFPVRSDIRRCLAADLPNLSDEPVCWLIPKELDSVEKKLLFLLFERGAILEDVGEPPRRGRAGDKLRRPLNSRSNGLWLCLPLVP